ncbi:DUF4142 domain-containing protein [Streptomyces sp. NPDC004647]|uniref:DUF4142 domain-containing protein n=1 Tax=Streptomyces sp. NPDC004647 TaxID=3154671 RepID=UPI0033A7BFD6
MRPNRRAVRPQLKSRPWVVIAAIVAALALIPVLISLQSGDSEASAEPAPAGGLSQHGGHQSGGSSTADLSPSAVQRSQSGLQGTTEVDKVFLVKVRQAGLWEIPAGRLAQTHASSEAVRRAGDHLIDGHSKLDQLVREDAKMLGVQLPDKATAEQQGWVDQLDNARGAEFDRLFANVLRASHGKIFATIGEVRAATQNDLIRRHARQANQTVLDHMEVLEDTGLVESKTFEEVEADVKPK